MQIHNVLSYVADLKWRAKLTSSKAELESARRGYKHGDVTPMAFVEQLEDMEARGVFPSDWLYSSGIDDLEFADVV